MCYVKVIIFEIKFGDYFFFLQVPFFSFFSRLFSRSSSFLRPPYSIFWQINIANNVMFFFLKKWVILFTEKIESFHHHQKQKQNFVNSCVKSSNEELLYPVFIFALKSYLWIKTVNLTSGFNPFKLFLFKTNIMYFIFSLSLAVSI